MGTSSSNLRAGTAGKPDRKKEGGVKKKSKPQKSTETLSHETVVEQGNFEFSRIMALLSGAVALGDVSSEEGLHFVLQSLVKAATKLGVLATYAAEAPELRPKLQFASDKLRQLQTRVEERVLTRGTQSDELSELLAQLRM